MACCQQTTSHYLKQSWHRSPEPYGVTRQQWVYSGLHSYYYHSANDCFFYSVPKWWSDMLYFIKFRWFHYWYIIISHVCSLSKSLFNLNSCPSTSEVTLQDMDEKDTTDAKHHKVWTVCMVKCCHVNGVCLTWWPLLELLSWKPIILVRWLQLIWRLGTCRWNLRSSNNLLWHD